MCLAIYKPAGAWASKAALHTAFKHNPNGAGYAWHDGAKVRLQKGFFTWRAFWKSYKRNVSAEAAAFIHFRIATRGGKTAANCHPFQLSNGVLMHNGPLLNATYCAGDDERSDSRQFAEDFIDGLEPQQVKRLQPMIEDFIGGEKVLMLFDDGSVVIAGESHGHWANGCWWSNSSYEDYEDYTDVTASYAHWPWRKPVHDYADEDAYGLFPPRDTSAAVIDVAAERSAVVVPPRLVWSAALLRPVRENVYWQGTEYEWNEEHHAYVRGELGPFAASDDEVVYDQSDETAELEEVGFVVADAEDYDDLIAVADATRPSVVAAATQE